MKWALQSDSESTPSTTGKEISNGLEEEENTTWLNWDESDVIVMTGDEVLGGRYRGFTTVQVVETGAEGEKVEGNAIVEVYDYPGGEEESASSTSKTSNGEGIDSREEENMLGEMGKDKRRNLEQRMVRREEEQTGKTIEDKAIEIGCGELQEEKQKTKDKREGVAVSAKRKSLVDPAYDDEDTEEEEDSE